MLIYSARRRSARCFSSSGLATACMSACSRGRCGCDGRLVRRDRIEVAHTTLLGTVSLLEITRGRKDHMIRLRANAIPINRKPAQLFIVRGIMDRTVKLFLNTLAASFANHADTFMRNVSCN